MYIVKVGSKNFYNIIDGNKIMTKNTPNKSSVTLAIFQFTAIGVLHSDFLLLEEKN